VKPPVPLAAGDRETLGFHGIIIPRDYADAIAALAGTGFVPPGRDLPPQPFRLPFDWNADPLKDGNWMFQLHAWRMLDAHLSRLLAEPGHPRAFADILEVIADWHRGNVQDHPGPFSWYDMATGLRALKLALLGQVAEQRGHVFEDPGLVADLVARHVAELSRPEGLGWNNHGLFQLSGLKALLWQYPDQPGPEAARAFATERMAALIDSQLGPEGVHTEHSPDYHFFTLTVISRHLKAPWWQLDAMAACREKLAAAGRARYWLVDPAGFCLPVGDSAASAKIGDFTGIERWPHQRQGETMGAVLDGYAMVRTDPAVPVAGSAMLFLTASFNSQTHKHADCLSLIWQEAGEDLLIDSGKYGYGGGAMRAYFLSTCAHNSIEIDGRGFSRKAEDAYGRGIRKLAPLGRTWLVEAEARHRQAGILHRRSVFFRPHHFLLAVDHVAADRPRRRTFTAWWHFNPDHAAEAEPDRDGRRPVSGLAGGRRLFVSHVASGDAPQVEWHRGTLEPRIQGWVSRGYLKSEPATALGFSGGSGRSFVAATLFELAGPGAAPRLDLCRTPSGRLLLTDGPGEPGAPAGAREGTSFAVGEAVLDLPSTLL
jgi:hypothetical protein